MGLCPEFFAFNKIDPDAVYEKSSQEPEPAPAECEVCKGLVWEHNAEQLEICAEALALQKQSPLRVRGGTLEDFKNACGRKPAPQDVIEEMLTIYHEHPYRNYEGMTAAYQVAARHFEREKAEAQEQIHRAQVAKDGLWEELRKCGREKYALEQELATAESRLREKLLRDVTEDEMRKFACHYIKVVDPVRSIPVLTDSGVNALLASRRRGGA